MLKGTPVALPEMLACREARVRQQQACLQQYKEPLISFCLNMPGPIKTSPELRKAFDCGQTAILSTLRKKLCPSWYAWNVMKVLEMNVCWRSRARL
jgi:holo-ACP synthase